MATTPALMQPTPQATGLEMMGDEQEGTEVCITVAPDGSLSVYLADERGAHPAQPAGSLQAALKMASDLVTQAQGAAGAADPNSQTAGFASV